MRISLKIVSVVLCCLLVWTSVAQSVPDHALRKERYSSEERWISADNLSHWTPPKSLVAQILNSIQEVFKKDIEKPKSLAELFPVDPRIEEPAKKVSYLKLVDSLKEKKEYSYVKRLFGINKPFVSLAQKLKKDLESIQYDPTKQEDVKDALKKKERIYARLGLFMRWLAGIGVIAIFVVWALSDIDQQEFPHFLKAILLTALSIVAIALVFFIKYKGLDVLKVLTQRIKEYDIHNKHFYMKNVRDVNKLTEEFTSYNGKVVLDAFGVLYKMYHYGDEAIQSNEQLEEENRDRRIEFREDEAFSKRLKRSRRKSNMARKRQIEFRRMMHTNKTFTRLLDLSMILEEAIEYKLLRKGLKRNASFELRRFPNVSHDELVDHYVLVTDILQDYVYAFSGNNEMKGFIRNLIEHNNRYEDNNRDRLRQLFKIITQKGELADILLTNGNFKLAANHNHRKFIDVYNEAAIRIGYLPKLYKDFVVSHVKAGKNSHQRTFLNVVDDLIEQGFLDPKEIGYSEIMLESVNLRLADGLHRFIYTTRQQIELGSSFNRDTRMIKKYKFEKEFKEWVEMLGMKGVDIERGFTEEQLTTLLREGWFEMLAIASDFIGKRTFSARRLRQAIENDEVEVIEVFIKIGAIDAFTRDNVELAHERAGYLKKLNKSNETSVAIVASIDTFIKEYQDKRQRMLRKQLNPSPSFVIAA